MTNQVNYDASVSHSRKEKLMTIGLDFGGDLWVMGVLKRNTGTYHYTRFQGLGKEPKCYEILKEYLKEGYAIYVTYEASCFGFSPARPFLDLGFMYE